MSKPSITGLQSDRRNIIRPVNTSPNNGMQRSALRAVADAERYTHLDMTEQRLNPLGIQLRDSPLRRHESWGQYVSALPSGDLELVVPAPQGSRAGHLVVFTARGEDMWIRYSPPSACYSVETDREMHAVVDALLADDAFFVVVTDGDTWIETTLLRPREEPVLSEGQVANVVSWSGKHDKVVTYTEKSPVRGV